MDDDRRTGRKEATEAAPSDGGGGVSGVAGVGDRCSTEPPRQQRRSSGDVRRRHRPTEHPERHTRYRCRGVEHPDAHDSGHHRPERSAPHRGLGGSLIGSDSTIPIAVRGYRPHENPPGLSDEKGVWDLPVPRDHDAMVPYPRRRWKREDKMASATDPIHTASVTSTNIGANRPRANASKTVNVNMTATEACSCRRIERRAWEGEWK